MRNSPIFQKCDVRFGKDTFPASATIAFSYDRDEHTESARQITVLTGASGEGKTTLTDLLLGFWEPDSGRILVDGVPLSELDWSKWRGMIGYVPLELQLFHESILMNVEGWSSIPLSRAYFQVMRSSTGWIRVL